MSGMTDRDKFAAAALTGLLAAPTDKDRSWEYWARLSYEAADAMLQERKGVTESKPAASAGIGSVTPVPYAKHDEKRVDWHTAGGTNHDAVPEAKAACEDSQPQAAAALGNPAMASNAGCTGNTPEPVAWAVMDGDWFHDVRLMQSGAEWYATYLNNKAGQEKCGVVPLYRQPQPTLTDAERVSLEWVVGDALSVDGISIQATLRGLLDRLK